MLWFWLTECTTQHFNGFWHVSEEAGMDNSLPSACLFAGIGVAVGGCGNVRYWLSLKLAQMRPLSLCIPPNLLLLSVFRFILWSIIMMFSGNVCKSYSVILLSAQKHARMSVLAVLPPVTDPTSCISHSSGATCPVPVGRFEMLLLGMGADAKLDIPSTLPCMEALLYVQEELWMSLLRLLLINNNKKGLQSYHKRHNDPCFRGSW